MEETYFAINEAQQLELETDETGVLDLMDQICRLCAQWTENLIHLFSEPAVQKGLVEMINLHLPLEVKVCDVLPLHICNSCTKKVEVCHELIQTSLASQTQLLELFAPLIDNKLPESSTCNINEKPLSNNSNVIPECAEMVENNPTMNEMEMFNKKIGPSINDSTVMEPKAINLFSPSDSENSLMENCDKKPDDIENWTECEPTAPPNKCQPCDLVFDDIDCLTSHQIAVHATNVFCCWDCNILFGTEVEYESHAALHHVIGADGDPFEALALSVVEDMPGTAAEAHVKIHLYTHNDEMKPLACEHDGCTKRFTSKKLLQAHGQSHSDERQFRCKICHATFKQMKGLIRHNETQHLEASYQCTVCSNIYKSSQLLADHMRSHSAARMYKCDECGMEFAQANRRNQHKAVHADERKHKCHLCASSFKRASHLSAHVKRHGRTHAYKCTACGLPFDSLREVSAHRKTHPAAELNATRRRTPARPSLGAEFQCPVCEKLLLTKVTLQNHLALHTDVKPYQCDLCDQSFTTESHMTNHRVIHSGMKPFPCQYCPEGFMYKEEREVHERTHTVVNPYVCEFCDGEFTSKMSLNQHLAVHADVRRHACDFCDQRFRRRDTLDAHIRTHTGERPFACSFCTQSFKQKGDCIMHERKSHKDQVHINSAVASISNESSNRCH